jgi:hypothetical protein
MIQVLLATAALGNPFEVDDPFNVGVNAELGNPDVYIADDWHPLDIAAAPQGRVIFTLEQSCDPALCEGSSFRLAAHVNGERVHTLDFDGILAKPIAIDHLYAAGEGKEDADAFVMVSDNNLIFAFTWVPSLGQTFLTDPIVAPGPITQPLDIAAGNDSIYVAGLDANDHLFVMAHQAGEWIATDTPIVGAIKPDSRRPAIDLDRTRNRLTLGHKNGLFHYTEDLDQVGDCLVNNDWQDPHLGREFAVEDGVLIYINYTSKAHPEAVFEHRMHIADADACVSLDVLDSVQSYTMHINTGALNAMSIEPQPRSEWWPLSQSPEPYVRSWTTLTLSKEVPFNEPWVGVGSGIFLVEGFMTRPFF